MKLITTNPTCINSDGAMCTALAVIHEGCHGATCPFYKTESEFKVAEAKAWRRCEDMGIQFFTRERVIDDINRVARASRKRQDKKRSKRGVIKYNSQEHIYVEYDSIESCSQDTKIPLIKLELLIEKKEPYGGYRYIYT